MTQRAYERHARIFIQVSLFKSLTANLWLIEFLCLVRAMKPRKDVRMSLALSQENLASVHASKRFRALYERALNFDVDAVTKRLSKDHSFPFELSSELMIELKRFLVFCGVNRHVSVAIAGPVDEAWHTFIIFTKKYHEFCDLVMGEYIHHQPTGEDHGGEEFNSSYGMFLEGYKSLFGLEPPPHIWPPANQATSLCIGTDSQTRCASVSIRAQKVN